MTYRIDIKSSAVRELEKIPKKDRQRIDVQIQQLAENPRPHGAIKLTGHPNLYRVRSGNYRIVYVIDDEVLTILITRIADRKDSYRDL